MNSNLEQITGKIKNIKPDLRARYSVISIGIFGSFARGDETLASDLDILVEMDKPVDIFKFIELEEELSGLTGRKVDLVSRKALKPAIGARILQEVYYI